MTYVFSTMYVLIYSSMLVYIFLTCHSSIITCNLHPLTVLPIHNHFKYMYLFLRIRFYSSSSKLIQRSFPQKQSTLSKQYTLNKCIIPVISYQDYYAVIFFKAKRAVFLSLNIFVFTRATCSFIENSD